MGRGLLATYGQWKSSTPEKKQLGILLQVRFIHKKLREGFTGKWGKDLMTSAQRPLVSYSHARWKSKMLFPANEDLTRHPAAFQSCFLTLPAALHPKGEKQAVHKNERPKTGAIFSHRLYQLVRVGARGLSPPCCRLPTWSWLASPLTCLVFVARVKY